jgi:hypothetical protein
MFRCQRFATANPSVGGFDVSVSAIFIGSREIMTQRIRGVLAPVVTPFKADLAPDRQRFIAHCKWLLSQNCGLAVFGTNSEANSLSMEERAMLLDELVAAGVDPSRMMPGTGCCSIMETVKLTKQAVGNGCAGVLMLPPFYYKDVDQEGLYRYFSEVVQRVGDARRKFISTTFRRLRWLASPRDWSSGSLRPIRMQSPG